MVLWNFSGVLLFYNIFFYFQLTSPPEIMSTFLYFAYGSNLLAQRIHIKNPTAVRIGIGKLNGYRLDFNSFSRTWAGSPSTVVPDVESHVWGALWQLDIKDMESLDRQEGVGIKKYEPFEAIIETPDGKNMSCRCYKLVDQPEKVNPLPLERRPSKAYIKTILLGAKESNLPPEYLKFLDEIPNNGNDGPSMPWLDNVNSHNQTINISKT